MNLWRAFTFIVVGLWRAFVFSLSWVPPLLALVRFWFRRTSAIVDKEIRQLFRERLTLGMIVGLPLIQIILFGYAINTDVRHMAPGWWTTRTPRCRGNSRAPWKRARCWIS